MKASTPAGGRRSRAEEQGEQGKSREYEHELTKPSDHLFSTVKPDVPTSRLTD